MPDPDAALLADPVHPPRDGLSRGPHGSDRERIGCTATGGTAEVQAGVDGVLRGSQPLLRHEPSDHPHVRSTTEGVEIPFPTWTVRLSGDTPGPT